MSRRSGPPRLPSPPGPLRPPRIAQWLLWLMLDRADREYILGDIAAEYQSGHSADGALLARLRYWRHVAHAIRPSTSARLDTWRERRRRRRATRPPRTHLGETMDKLRRDLGFAVRMLRRNPLFATVTVLTLALGIGANTAIFSVVRGILLKPLPYAQPARLAILRVGWDESGSNRASSFGHSISQPELYDFRRGNRTLEGIGAYSRTAVNVTGAEGDAERVAAATISANAFTVLGVTAAIGRTFTPEEDLPGAAGVALLGHDFWQRRYVGDAEILGKDIIINGRPRTVVGVMAPDFRLPTDFGGGLGSQIWLPIRFDEDNLQGRGSHYLSTVTRLKPGVSIQQASSDLQTIAEALTEQGHYHPEANFRAIVTPLTDQIVGNVRPALLVLFGAVGLVLLIACANVANLMLARGESRKRELAVRTALGAARGVVIRQLMTESVVLGLLGGLAGVLLAKVGLRALIGLDPSSVPRLAEVQLDATVLAYATVVSVFTGLLFGILPALRSGGIDLQADLREGGRGATAGRRRHSMQRALVGTQIGLAVILVIAASLTIKSFGKLIAIDPGFDASNVLSLRLSIPSADYPENADISGYYIGLLDRIRALPGVSDAAAARVLPLAQGIGDWSISIEGRVERPGEDFDGDWQFVTPGYFETMRIPLLEGRFFDNRDRVDSHKAVIVNQAMASLYWPGESAIGKRIRFCGSCPTLPWVEIVGVVGNIRHNGISGQINSKWYAPHAQTAASVGFTSNAMTLVIRTDGDPVSIVSAVRREVRARDANVPVAVIQTMEDVVSASVAEPRFTMTLLLVFGGVALLLAAVGVYGVISYTISERTHEWGLRRALGATSGDVVSMIVRQGMTVAGAGVAAGLLGAYWLTRFMSSLLYEIGARDPVTFLAVPVILALVAFAATLLPARRAVAVEPSRALREG